MTDERSTAVSVATRLVTVDALAEAMTDVLYRQNNDGADPSPGIADYYEFIAIQILDALEVPEALEAIFSQHTPDVATDSDQDGASIWMTCSCGWDQSRDLIQNEYVLWEDHVRAALAAPSVPPPLDE